MGAIFDKIKENATQFPHKIAIIEYQGESLTYSQLFKRVESSIYILLKNIIPQNTRVAFCLHEGIDIPILVLALNALGVPIIPLNPGLKSEQIKHLLLSVDADVVIIESKTARLFHGIHNEINVINLSTLSESAVYVKSDAYRYNNGRHYDQFLITLSSGSTGNPKPIIFSEKNKMDRSAQAVRLYGVTSNDIVLCGSPFFHSLGQRLTLLPLIEGATLVQLPRFGSKRWCDAVATHKVTFTISVSSHLHELVSPILNFSERLTSLRSLVSSSAAINNEIKRKLFESLSCDFHEMYGASEVATATDLSKKNVKIKSGSVGAPCPGVEVLVVDKNLLTCSPKQVGQIIIKSPLASKGYYKLPQITEESFINDYFLTGDLGYLDEDGFLYFVDRKKDVIISGGMNIYPSDIENIIKEHPVVVDCIAIGIYDSYLIEVPVVIIVCQNNVKLIEKEIRGMLQKRLAPYQQPMKYFFKEHLPLTASGKVDKIVLRDEINSLGLDLSAKLRALQGPLCQDSCPVS